ncbi:MAG TPA: SDR family oxidoreductase, partial [Terriglobales bacterium]|nr:SDR family oxidoreductase [Terriglobales bacterium]
FPPGREIVDLMSESKLVLILGGTSDIGFATAKHYAAKSWSVCLAARDMATTQRNAKDIAARTGAEVLVRELNILDATSFDRFIASLPRLPDTVVCVIGLLGNRRMAEVDLEHATTIIRTNYEGPALLLLRFAEAFGHRRSGTIVGVSSVAGDRGRASNYIYGSAKAGLTAFLSGLRNRLASTGVHVVTVKPGYVRTRMTEHLALSALLTASPEAVATRIYEAAEIKKQDVIYVLRIWRLIIALISVIPERVFKNLRL